MLFFSLSRYLNALRHSMIRRRREEKVKYFLSSSRDGALVLDLTAEIIEGCLFGVQLTREYFFSRVQSVLRYHEINTFPAEVIGGCSPIRALFKPFEFFSHRTFPANDN